MTAPVVNSPPEFSPSTPTDAPTDTAETVPMTAPVLTTGAQTTRAPKTAQTMGGQTMAFVLPSTFSTVSSAPLPTDPAVRLRARPERLMAAIRFSGRCTDALAERKAAELHAKLVETGCVGGEEERPPLKWRGTIRRGRCRRSVRMRCSWGLSRMQRWPPQSASTSRQWAHRTVLQVLKGLKLTTYYCSLYQYNIVYSRTTVTKYFGTRALFLTFARPSSRWSPASYCW